MTKLLAADPKLSCRALTHRAFNELPGCPLAEETLRKLFRQRQVDGRLPRIETAEDEAERRIVAAYKTMEAAIEKIKLELAIKEQKALALGLDLSSVPAASFLAHLVAEKNRLEISLSGGDEFFFAGQMRDQKRTLEEALAIHRQWTARVKELRDCIEAVEDVVRYRRRLGLE
jgi:hypothetical protein